MSITESSDALQPQPMEGNGESRPLLDTLTVPVYATDELGRITFFNESAADLWGRIPELGKDLWCGSWKIFTPDGEPLPHDRCPMAIALREQRSLSAAEIVVERPDGERRNVLAYPQPLFDADGRFTGATNLLVDITERRRVEQELRESQQRLSAVISGAFEYIGVLSTEGILLEANDASLAFGPTTREKEIGRPFWDTIWFRNTEGSGERLRSSFARALAGEFVRYEASLARPNGELVTFDFSLRPIKDESGNVVLVVPEGRDITEAKQAELALRSSEEHFRTLFESLDEGFCLVELIYDESGRAYDYRFLNTNPAYERQTGHSSVIGRTMREVNPALKDFGVDVLARIAKSGKPERFDGTVEGGGRRRVYDVYSFPMGEGRVASLFNDITERKRREWMQALLVGVQDRLADLESADEIIELVGSELHSVLGIAFAFFVEVDEAAKLGRFEHVWHANDVPALPSSISISESLAGHIDDLLRRTELVVVNDTESDPRVEMERLRSMGIRSVIGIPFNRAGHWEAAIGIADTRPRRWLDDEVAVVSELAGRIFPRIERARADAARREAEARLQAIVSSTPDLVYIFDLEYRFTYVNQALLEMWGRTLEDSIGKRLLEVGYEPWHAEMHEREIDRVVATGESIRGEVPFRHAELGWRVYDYIFAPVLGPDGRVEGIAGTTRDITDLRSVQDMLRANEDRQSFLLQLNDALNALSDHAEMVFTASRMLGEHLAASRVACGEVVAGNYVIERDWVNGLESIAGTFPVANLDASLAGDVATGSVVTADDATGEDVGEQIGAFIAVPVVKNGEFVGGIAVHSSTPREWTPVDVEVTAETLSRLREAIARARVEAALRFEDERRTFLLRLNDVLQRSITPERIQEEAARHLAQHLGAARVMFVEVEEGSEFFVVRSEYHQPGLRSASGRYGLRALDRRVIEQGRAGKMFSVSDTHDRERYPTIPVRELGALDAIGTRAYLAVPLFTYGRLGAYLAICHSGPMAWTDALMSLVQEAAERTWTLVQRARFERELADDLAAASQLQRLSTELIRESGDDDLYDKLLAAAVVVMHSQAASLQMLVPERGELHLLAYRGFHDAAARFWEWVSASSGSTCGIALQKSVRVIASDVELADSGVAPEDVAMYRLCGIRAVQSTPLVSRTGQILGMISTHWSRVHQPSPQEFARFDILARQAADLIERRLADEALRASEQRLAQAIEIAELGHWQLDLHTLELQASERARANFGRGPDEPFTFEDMTRAIDPGDAEEQGRVVAAAIESRGAFQIEYRASTPSGETRWVDVHGQFEPGGEAGRLVGVSRDITDRKRVEEGLREAARLKDELLGLISHEFRNPLTTLVGNIDLLRREVPLTASERGELVADLERDGQRLKSLIENMLLLSQASTGETVTEPVLVQRAIPTFLESLRARHPGRNIDFVSEPDVAVVLASPAYLEQVMENLVSNAAKYGRSQSPIVVRAAQSDGGVTVSVENDGEEYTEDEVADFIEPFFRGSESRDRVAGLGLGMSVCRRLVEIQGGTLTVIPRAGGGVVASFTLPLADTEA